MHPITDFLMADKASVFNNSEDRKLSKAEVSQALLNFKSSLPKLKNRHIILEDGRKVKVGNILRRPIIKNFPVGDIFHYCFVYGTSIDGNSVIIEMTMENNVMHNDLLGFLKTHSIDSVEIINKENDTKMKDIVLRASEWTGEVYHGYTKNCQQFANYCVFGEYKSSGVNFLNKLFLPWVNLFIQSTKHSISIANEVSYIEHLQSQLHELKLIFGIMQNNINSGTKVIQEPY